ncbi:MAG: hypothetical protein KKH34_01030 [Candidatus Omnitrophica bacterium]|nr:hypothetical protein [Candidatus Omnitrophota bacterium]
MKLMASIQIKALVKERDALAEKLCGFKHILRGTILKRGNICGKAGCRCKRKDNPILHGPYQYLSHRSTKSINMIFLNKKKLPYAVRGIKEYNESISIIYRIAEINFKILRYYYAGLADE